MLTITKNEKDPIKIKQTGIKLLMENISTILKTKKK